jgi:hypothetical protein|tara:strand:- start:4250 stop:4975 length:726 start_codon:yes stop_codon:yes gene_type:complete
MSTRHPSWRHLDSNLLMTVLLVLPIAVVAGADYTASSYHQETGELVYTEQYRQQGQQARVVFLDPGGEEISNKALDFSVAEFLPNIDFTNLSSGDQWYIHPTADKIAMGYKKAGEIKWSEGTSDHDRPSVFDAGYPTFLQASREQLLADKKVAFYSPIPFIKRSFKMQARLSFDEDCPLDPQQYYCIKLVAANVLLRLASPAIYMSFTPLEFRLKAYSGPTNTAIGDEQRFYVRTLYDYSP